MGAKPSSRLIDGLLLIPPLRNMNGPAAIKLPTVSRPRAHRLLDAGNPSDGHNGKTMSVADERDQNDQSLRARQVSQHAGQYNREKPGQSAGSKQPQARPDAKAPEQQKRALAERVSQHVAVERHAGKSRDTPARRLRNRRARGRSGRAE